MKTTAQPEDRRQPAALEQAWVRKIREGNAQAFERLFSTYCGPLVHFAGRYVGDLAVAENIVQDVFVNVWNRREQLDPTAAIKAYLYTAVKKSGAQPAAPRQG